MLSYYNGESWSFVCVCVHVFQSQQLAPKRGWSQSWWPPSMSADISLLVPTHTTHQQWQSDVLIRPARGLQLHLVAPGYLKWPPPPPPSPSLYSTNHFTALLQQLWCTANLVTSSLCDECFFSFSLMTSTFYSKLKKWITIVLIKWSSWSDSYRMVTFFF